MEAERDRDRLLADLEVPELVLQYDRHLFRVFRAQLVGDLDPRHLRHKAQIEMVAAAQPLARRPLQRVAHDAAQRALDHLVVLEQILRHRPRPAPATAREVSEGLLLPGAPRTASYFRFSPREGLGRKRLMCEVIVRS